MIDLLKPIPDDHPMYAERKASRERVDYLVVEDAEQLASAMRYFGTDLPLTKTMVVELWVNRLSDGSEVSMLSLREADPV